MEQTPRARRRVHRACGGLLQTREGDRPREVCGAGRRWVRGSGGGLAGHGALLVLVGAAALLGAFGLPPADSRALRWHVLLWDPWFLGWGVLLAVGAVAHRRRARGRG
ncbi:hypothetical protein [Geodermatophilus sp. SYSU D01105]